MANVASGLIYTGAVPKIIDEAKSQVNALRGPALERGGYAVITQMPNEWRGAVDAWGYAPDTLNLMHALKSRYDPAGIGVV